MQKKIEELDKKVSGCLDTHKKALIAYAMNPENKSIIPGKLKIPFDFLNKSQDINKDKPIPGKLKNPFDNQETKEKAEEKTNPRKIKAHSRLYR